MDGIIIPVRGCTMSERRRLLWAEIRRWDALEPSHPNYRNSYMQLKAERNNRWDPKAIAVWCRGEAYGQLGYVAREHTDDVRALLPDKCGPSCLMCRVADWSSFENGTVMVEVWLDGR